jgi:transposase
VPLTFAGTLHWYLDNWRALRCKRAAQARQMVRRLSEFCTPGAGHEKGGIEGEAGYFRRNHWVPIPDAPDLAALNAQLLAACQADQLSAVALY